MGEEVCRVLAHNKEAITEVVPSVTGFGEEFYLVLGSGLENPFVSFFFSNSVNGE